MADPSNPHLLQQRTLASLLALGRVRSNWAGELILSLGLDTDGTALAIAANISGAVSLSVDEDPNRLRDVARVGAVDFVVKSLDEAVRVIKNEVRQKRPLAVALGMDTDRALQQMMDRGLAPAAVYSRFTEAGTSASFQNALEYFSSLGAQLIDFTSAEDSMVQGHSVRAAGLLSHAALEENKWSIATFSFASPSDLRAFDQEIREHLNLNDEVRQRWMTGAPRVFQRQRPPHCCLLLTLEETERAEAIYARFRSNKPLEK